MADIKITKTTISRFDNVDWNNLGFGRFFSDHVYVADYINGEWTDGEIMPYGDLLFEPAMCTLHYGQTIFEGLKAFRSVDGGINIFRPDMNAKRLNTSSVRVCIPEFSEYRFLDAIHDLVKVDQNWVPDGIGKSLYLRPVVFGTGNFLGVHKSDTYKMIIMGSPVASYYTEGLNPLKILISHEFVRAVRGGLGTAKTAANYVASLLATEKAKAAGFSQVLWLDGVNLENIDEVGAMNIMFVIGDELITPPLTQGTILAGVTRDTVIKLAEDMGLQVAERAIKVKEVFDAHRVGLLKEVFGTGTAAVISPVGLLHYQGNSIVINDNQIGYYTQKFYDTIVGIQRGSIEDKFNWNFKISL